MLGHMLVRHMENWQHVRAYQEVKLKSLKLSQSQSCPTFPCMISSKVFSDCSFSSLQGVML